MDALWLLNVHVVTCQPSVSPFQQQLSSKRDSVSLSVRLKFDVFLSFLQLSLQTPRLVHYVLYTYCAAVQTGGSQTL